jgi:WD40 repeat protein
MQINDLSYFPPTLLNPSYSFSSPILRLPEELLTLIFSYLSTKNLVHAGMVCRQWNRIKEDPILWTSLYRYDFPFFTSPNSSYTRAMYINSFVTQNNLKAGKIQKEIQLPPSVGGKTFFDFSDSAGFLLVEVADKTRLWNLARGRFQNSPTQLKGDICSLFSPDGSLLATASSDGTVHLWNIITSTLVHNLKGHTGMVIHAVFSGDGKMLAILSDDRLVHLWKISTGECLHIFSHNEEIIHAIFSPDGRTLTIEDDNNKLHLWDITKGQPIHVFNYDGEIYENVFSPRGELLATIFEEKTVRVCKVPTGELLYTLNHEGDLWDCCFSPDGNLLATASQDHTVRLWEVVSGKLLHTFKHAGEVNKVAFTPDGSMLAAACQENYAILWDICSGQAIHYLKHEKEVQSVFFSPDGSVLVTTNFQGQVNLWTVAEGVQFANLKSASTIYNEIRVVFSKDGSMIVLATDSNIRILSFNPLFLNSSFS